MLTDSKFEAETGWQARVSLREGLQRTISWWHERFCQGKVRSQAGYMT